MSKKNDPDVSALKRAVKAILQSSSENAARAAVNYLYDAFVVHPTKETMLYFKNRVSAQHSVEPTVSNGGDLPSVSNQSEGESPA